MSPSPIRCRGPWKIQKRSSEPDRWLEEMGYFRKHTARDSSCLFRVMAENIYNTQRYFNKVRQDCVKFIACNKHLFEGSLPCMLDNYLNEMTNPSECGGMLEVSAMSHMYRRDFVIFDANKNPETNICYGYGCTIYLFHCPETKHFDAVYTKEFINNSAFCQLLLKPALVYELLYDKVYNLEDLSYAVDKMLHDKIPNNHIEYFLPDDIERHKKQKEKAKIFIEEANEKDRNNNALTLKCKHYTNDIEKASLLKESLSIFVFNRSLIQLENICMNCLNVNSAKDLLDNGITPFPYKVAKALDPDIYRNIEFDVWSELRRELRYGARYSDGTTLQVGVKCLCKLDRHQATAYHCHIQEMGPDDGPCLVFIEELGEKRVVNYDQLEPLPVEEVKPWAPPYRYSRVNSQLLNLSQMLQQIGNIARKQGMKSSKKSKSDDKSEKTQERRKLGWSEDKTELAQYQCNDINYLTYQHLDYYNYQPFPVEIEAVPLMVDCRAAGAPPQDIVHAPNGASTENHNQGAGGDMGTHNATSAVSVRASTPATTNSLTTYAGAINPGVTMSGPTLTSMAPNIPYNCAPYVCGVKSVLWCAPHSPPQPMAGVGGLGVANVPHVPPPPPHGVNPHVFKSVQVNGADLPMNVDCMWAAYGPPPPPQPPAPPHPAHHQHQPPRHYSPAAVAQEMQQMSLNERCSQDQHKHKGTDKQQQSRPSAQQNRPPLGPRFKRGGNNQDGNQNNHNMNKNHNNVNNKGPNNRRNNHVESRPVAGGYGEELPPAPAGVDQPVLAFPYAPYPPPIYPLPYYHIEEPAMMGMMGGMGGMGYVSYEDGVEYLQPLYPPPYPPPPALHDHK